MKEREKENQEKENFIFINIWTV